MHCAANFIYLRTQSMGRKTLIFHFLKKKKKKEVKEENNIIVFCVCVCVCEYLWRTVMYACKIVLLEENANE